MAACKYCGESCPEIIREVVKEVKVEVGDNSFWIRFWAITMPCVVLIVAAIAGAISYSCYLDNVEMNSILKDPATKIEILDSHGSHVIRKISR